MVVVDSSGWIEFFTDGPKANAYERYLREPQKIVTPVVVVYEVYKKIKRERSEDLAKLCVAQIEKTRLVPVDLNIALLAVDLSLQFSLPMADSMVLATVRTFRAQLVTSDADFRKLPGSQVI